MGIINGNLWIEKASLLKAGNDIAQIDGYEILLDNILQL